jgi:Cu+-exporting ATPase
MVATGVAAKYGIFVKGGETLERASNIKTVVFDKTGTLTSGIPHVTDVNIEATDEYSEELIWDLLLAAESNSEHPLGKAVCKHKEPTTRRKTDCFYNFQGEGI